MKLLFKTVKKLIEGTLLFTFLAVSSFSQKNRFSLSINSTTTNFNYGNANKQLKPYKKNVRGIQVGVSYQAGITPMFSVVPELYFSMKGGRLKKDNPLTTNKSTLRLYTINMPVLARLHCKKLYVNAGPYFGYTLSGRLKIEGSDNLPEKTTAISFNDDADAFNRWDLGVQAGGGYNFDIKKNMLTVDVRYGYGLVNISKNVDRYNRMFNISLLGSKHRL
ncbi:porin family protein [Segetibacter koreensis]|uniref:porin family protein n=1 Tax=Segetibacter koreensis TaxID=398037 RepID=UPI0012F938C7|nr:porin family protein [Segetibacter koreensis]